jgi:hypothetical protein
VGHDYQETWAAWTHARVAARVAAFGSIHLIGEEAYLTHGTRCHRDSRRDAEVCSCVGCWMLGRKGEETRGFVFSFFPFVLYIYI